jgi:RNA polymerase sigma-70 factor, ECF subfamily
MIAMLLAMVGSSSDAELVEQFKGGDRDAFAEIVRRYENRVFTQCLRWMGNEQIAREVAQDVFIALFRSLPRFRGDSRLSTWIYRVVINHCKNRRLYRKRRHMTRHEPLEGPPTDDGPARQIPSDGPGTDHVVQRSEAEVLVRQGLANLDEEQRQIIILRDIQDLSYEEIGEILELARGTVKSRLHRARKQLAHHLEQHVRREDVI